MLNQFQLAGGSVVGRSHRMAGKNNQDAMCCLRLQNTIVATVCDGCGSGLQSEVGAHLGARLVTQAIVNQLARGGGEINLQSTSDVEAMLEKARRKVLHELRRVAKSMGDDMASIVTDYFLFTVVGVCLTPKQALFFSLGDGLIVVNGKALLLGPFPGNAPPYLAYGLVPGRLQCTQQALCFRIQQVLPTSEVQSFLIATDGVEDLRGAADRMMPGRNERVGAIEQFWCEERYFSNPDMIRRRLAGINRDVVVGEQEITCKQNGLLSDDTTLIVGRRKLPVQSTLQKEV
jgi:uncharacterized protein YbjQ (UPF0145 family)